MPGRVAIDHFVSPQAGDFHSEAEYDGDKTQNSFYIPRSKRKKSKNRRHSDTIWTIVQEQENPPSASKPKSKSKSSKHHNPKKESSKHNKSKESKKSSKSGKKNVTSTPTDPNRRASFLDNPIFETDLKNWTLPRVELWCRDPGCQINVQLWRDYCITHQAELTQLQVEELQQQQHHYLHHHNHHYQHQHQDQHHEQFTPSLQTIPRSQRLSSITSAYCFDDCVGSSPVVPMVLCDKSSAGGSHECRHPFHHREEDQYYQHHHHQQGHQHRQSSHGNMHMNMSIGSSMNNLSAQDAAAAAAALSSSMSTYPPPHSTNRDSNKSYNNINHPPPPPPPPSSVIISVPSGASSSTNNSNSGKTTSTTVSLSHHQVNSTNATSNGGSIRDDFSGSTSSSSSASSASGTDVSSGSTFVTGFDSSDSRNSSVPHSLSKVPHPNLITESNHRTEPTSYSSHNHKMTTQSSDHHHHHHHMMGYGDSTNTASGGYPSLPYIPSGYRKPGVCPSCNGLVPQPTNHHLVPVDPIISSGGHGGSGGGDGPLQQKSDNAFWNFTKFQHPLQRDHSFHSVGGFTLNGQYNTQVKKRPVVKFCSSHKIALVVSTFSLMVTVGLIITLILMKKRGMMDTMDMMPT